MIFRNGRKIDAIWYAGRALAYVWENALLVWQSVRSCFGSGTWLCERPWMNEEEWSNGKTK